MIELLAVIVILAIILVIAVPKILDVINDTKISAFESDAEMVLKAIKLKVFEDNTFNPITLDETNIKTLLNIENSNYKSVEVTNENEELNLIIVGKNKWNDLVASSNSTNTRVHQGVVLWLDAGKTNSYPGTGNTWYDLSGNGNNATKSGDVNNPTWDSNGYWIFPASIAGVNGGMTIANSTTLQSVNTMTVELVFTLQSKTSVAGDTDWMCLFSKGSTSQTPAISINQLTTSNRFLHVERPSAYNSVANLFTDYTGNQWYYVTAVISTTSFSYLNGTQVSTSADGIIANNYPIYIGLDSDNEMFKGKLAVVRVYNKALTPQQIQQNYNTFKLKFNI